MGATSDAVAIRELEARLHRPDRGELGYQDGKEARTRLEALARLREFAEEGKVERTGPPGGVNTHVHTAKSFGYFDSPSDAVWHAYLARLAIFGINDHHTMAGHEEFGKACRIVGIRAAFSMEVIAMWHEAARAGRTVNDPSNPGRTYLSAKGTTRPFAPDSPGARNLARMCAAQLERTKEIARKVADVVARRLGADGAIQWEDVVALAPHGQPTERHVALVVARHLETAYPDPSDRRKALSRLAGRDVPDEVLQDAATFQDTIRASLIKAGKPAYVEESEDAFIPVEEAVSMALELGAIPAYPVLGDPVTPWEEDLEVLFDRLEALRIYAIEVIPNRNRRERLLEIVTKAVSRGFPIFTGTEHNTKVPLPLVDKFFFDPEFRPHFELGARVLLGHQSLRKAGEPGFVNEDGTLPPGDRAEHLRRVAEAFRRR
ncbi:MAG: hypothetical protein ACUVYA_06705 [Planctomycetota bacterium]